MNSIISSSFIDYVIKVTKTSEFLFLHIFLMNMGNNSRNPTYYEYAQTQVWSESQIRQDSCICTINIPALLDVLEHSEDDLVIDVKREVVIGTTQSRLLELPSDIPLDCTIDFDSICNRFDIEEFFMIHSTNVRTDFLREHEIKLLEHTFYVDYEFIVKIASFASTIRFTDLEVCNYFIGSDESLAFKIDNDVTTFCGKGLQWGFIIAVAASVCAPLPLARK